MEDILVKATVPGVRIYALRTTGLTQELNEIHHCSPLAAAALGRAANGALLLAATMKDSERVTLRLRGNGPLGEVIADARDNTVRGLVANPEAMLPPKNGKLDVGGGVGAGNIVVTRFPEQGEPFTGYCELVNGEIATDLTNYLVKSEQTPSSVALGVLVDTDGKVIASGGYFVQAMPGAEDEVLGKLEDNVISLPYVTELLQAGFTPEQIIRKVADGLEVDIKETIPVRMECTCSRQKVADMLRALPDKDLEEICEDAVTEIHCHFCNKSYKFTSMEIKELKNKKNY